MHSLQFALRMEKYQLKTGHKHISKQNLQSITICNYYLKILFPTIFNSYPSQSSDFAKFKVIDRNIAYNYAHQIVAGIQGLSEDVILQAGKLTYFSKQCSKVQQNSFLKTTTIKLHYLPIWRQISQEIDIFVVKQDQKNQESQRRGYRSPHKNQINQINRMERKKSHHLISINKIEDNSKDFLNYSLFIVHYNKNTTNDSSLQWQNFIEKYTFRANKVDGQVTSSIKYETIFSYSVQASLLNLNQSQKILQQFYQKSVYTENHENQFSFLEKTTGKLRSLVQMYKIKTNLSMQSVSFDASHRRELKLTLQHKNIFNSLKTKTFAYFGSLNRKKEINRYFLENLICRMMSNQNYKQNQSWEAIKYYLQFEKKMRDKYRWSAFQKYDKMNIFVYIGKDMLGRPILLNRIRNTLCSKIQNFDEFFDYHFYLFEIYMQDQMEGWVDQFVVIADASNQVTDNTNLGFTKRILMEGYKVVLGRPYKIIAFDVGFIGTAFYRVLKPILPNSLSDCVKVLGEDREELLEQLRQHMTDDAIPEFIGGKNPTLQTKKVIQQPQEKLNTEMTTDRSMLRSVRSMRNL